MSELHGGSGDHGFYAKAYLVDPSDSQWNHERWVASCYKAWSSTKNTAFVVFEGAARGNHKTSDGGGVGHDSMLVSRAQWVHLTKQKRWCFHRESSEIQAILFDENLTLPGAINPLLHSGPWPDTEHQCRAFWFHERSFLSSVCS